MTAPTPIEELNMKPKPKPHRYCEDCAFHYVSAGVNDRCDKKQTPSPVRRGISDAGFCEVERMFDLPKHCGPDAKWFLAKRVTVEMDDACSKSAELREGLSEENAA